MIVFGAGAVGLLTAVMAQLCGATNVLIADIDTGRVQYALKHNFAAKGYVVSVPGHGNCTEEKIRAAQYIADEVLHTTFASSTMGIDEAMSDPPLGADVVFDCTGKEICVQAGLFVCGSREDW